MAVRVARPSLLLTLLLILITLTSGLLGPPKKYAGEGCAKKEECWAKRTTPGCDCTGGKCTTQCMGNGRSGPKAAKIAKAAGPKPTVLQGLQCKVKTDCIKINPSGKKCFCSYNGKGDKKVCRGKNCKPNPAAPKIKTKKDEKKAVKKVEKKVIPKAPHSPGKKFEKTPEKKVEKKVIPKAPDSPLSKKKVIKTPEKKAVKKAKKKVIKTPDSPLSKKKVVKTCKKNKDCPGMFCKCFFGKCRGKCNGGNGISKAQFGDFDDELYDDELYDDAVYNDELYGEELYDNDIDYNSNYVPEFSVMFISIITLCLCGVFCIGLSVIMGLCGWYIGKYVLQYSQNNKNYKLIQRDGITDIEQNNE